MFQYIIQCSLIFSGVPRYSPLSLSILLMTRNLSYDAGLPLMAQTPTVMLSPFSLSITSALTGTHPQTP
jgi:hypothetical protein